jgi:hypothetical protein
MEAYRDLLRQERGGKWARTAWVAWWLVALLLEQAYAGEFAA